MNQRHLEYFLEVYKHKSIKNAADNLHITPQGISKTILALEEELHQTLFDRSGKIFVPTPAAINLKWHAQKILDEYQLIMSQEYLTSTPKTTLKVLSSYHVLQYLTVDFIRDFQLAYPDILLNMTESTDKTSLLMLQNEDAEIALLPAPLDFSLFDAEFLFSSYYCTIINKEHPLAQKSSISFRDLDQQPIAIKGREFSLYNEHQRILYEHGVEPVTILETSSYHIIHRMAEANLAIGASLDYIAFSDPQPNTVILPFESKEMVKTIYLTEKKDKQLSSEAMDFKNFLLAWIHDHKDNLFHWE